MLSVCLGLLRKAWSEAFFENCWRKFVVCRFCASDAAAGADWLVTLAANEISDGSDPAVFLPALISFVTGASDGGVTVASASLLRVSAALARSADCTAAVLLSAKPSPDRAAAAAAPCSNTFSGAAASFAGTIGCCMASFIVSPRADWCSRHHQMAEALTRTTAKAVAVMSRGHEIPNARQRDSHSSFRAKREIS